MKATLHAAGLSGFGAVALSSLPAQAQRTRFQGITQCSRFASVQFSRTDPTFRRFVIERVTVQDDKFATSSAINSCRRSFTAGLLYEGAGVPKRVRFICLHGGTTKGPVFVYTIPE